MVPAPPRATPRRGLGSGQGARGTVRRRRRTAAQITAEADAARLAATQRTGTEACVRYLTGKDEYLRYDQALAAG